MKIYSYPGRNLDHRPTGIWTTAKPKDKVDDTENSDQFKPMKFGDKISPDMLKTTPWPGAAPVGERPKPAAPINKSVQHEYIVCLEDGKKLKMLKRYLRSTYGMTPEDYRKRWGLPADYPMVAPAYAARRSEFAKKIGLGKGVRRKG